VKNMEKEEKLHLIVALVLLGILTLATAVTWYTGHLSLLIRAMTEAFSGREELRTYVESWGAWAPVVFIVLQALQVVIAPIPGELTGAVGGFIFGVGLNVLYSTVGLTVGSIFAFAGGRLIGLPLVKLFVSEESLRKFHFLTERRGTWLSLILFTFPGFPKDILCYVLGLSPMGFVTFLVVCTIGRLPGTIMLSYSGSAVYDENWTLLIAITVLCVVAMAVVYFTRDKVELWLLKRHGQVALAKCAVQPVDAASSREPTLPS
jgi:uncharacterized membrane protein YdjX (TVP38/TMEM64 family)